MLKLEKNFRIYWKGLIRERFFVRQNICLAYARNQINVNKINSEGLSHL